MGFPENLAKAREAKLLTKADMAKELGITAAAYGFYEGGRSDPKISTLIKICKLLDVSPNYLLFNESNNDWIDSLNSASIGFRVIDSDDNTVTLARTAFLNGFQRNENNTLVFKRSDIEWLWSYTHHEMGSQMFSDTMKKIFIENGLPVAGMNYCEDAWRVECSFKALKRG